MKNNDFEPIMPHVITDPELKLNKIAPCAVPVPELVPIAAPDPVSPLTISMENIIIIDGRIMAEATETLAAIGLSVSDAVREFLLRVIAEKQMPFALKVPNVETRSAVAEADEIVRAKRARHNRSSYLIRDTDKTRGK